LTKLFVGCSNEEYADILENFHLFFDKILENSRFFDEAVWALPRLHISFGMN